MKRLALLNGLEQDLHGLLYSKSSYVSKHCLRQVKERIRVP
jgi:hypothetical protein